MSSVPAGCGRAALWHIDGILTPEQEADGFEAFEDEDFIYIKWFGRVCLIYSCSGARKESIREDVESLRRGSGAAEEGAGEKSAN